MIERTRRGGEDAEELKCLATDEMQVVALVEQAARLSLPTDCRAIIIPLSVAWSNGVAWPLPTLTLERAGALVRPSSRHHAHP